MPLFERRKAWDLALGGKIVLLTREVVPSHSPNPGACPISVSFADGIAGREAPYPRAGVVELRADAPRDVELATFSNVSFIQSHLLPKGMNFRLFTPSLWENGPRWMNFFAEGRPWLLQFQELEGDEPRSFDIWLRLLQDNGNMPIFSDWLVEQEAARQAQVKRESGQPVRLPPVVRPEDQGRRFFGANDG